MLKLEEKAPEFCLPNQDDIEICMRDLKGKWIVLYFFALANEIAPATKRGKKATISVTKSIKKGALVPKKPTSNI